MRTTRLRRSLAGGAATLMLAGGAAVVASPAHAEPSASDCVTSEAHAAGVAAARAEVVRTKADFRTSLRPLAAQVRETRREAHREVRAQRATLRGLWSSLRGASPSERSAARGEIKAAARELRDAQRTVRAGRRALLRQVKVEQGAAKRAWHAAVRGLRVARAVEVCPETDVPETDAPVTDAPETDVPEETAGTGEAAAAGQVARSRPRRGDWW